MSAVVYVITGGIRFHEDSDCLGLAGGLRLSGGRYSPQGVRYKVRGLWSEDAARAGYTACRVCVPPALALPATGETYGHERLTINASCCGDDCCGYRTEQQVCGRCSEDVTRREGARWLLAVPWPCTSAVVLGLTPRDGAL